mgnify:CR=1 FL=1
MVNNIIEEKEIDTFYSEIKDLIEQSRNRVYKTINTEMVNLYWNIGKKIRLYITIPGSSEWQNKEFKGIIENVNKDHIILSDPASGEWHLIPIIYLGFITFEEKIKY